MSNQLTLFPDLKPFVDMNSTEKYFGTPRLKYAVRDQVEMMTKALDDLLPEDHLARDVWRFVQGLDLSIALNKIMSVEGNAGRPAIDPKILLALWLFATLKGIGSAKLH